MVSSKRTIQRELPAFLRDDAILVPLKVDVICKGARYVDSFCWKLFDSPMSPDEFVAITCADMQLAPAFQRKIVLQIEEQLSAYREIIATLRSVGVDNEEWLEQISQPFDMLVGLRYNNVDYTDKFSWNLTSSTSGADPELFARKTVEDLGLPIEMETAIAHRIRETLMNIILSVAENPDSPMIPIPKSSVTPAASTVEVFVSNPTQNDLYSSLWKRAKPQNFDDRSAIIAPKLPEDTISNANIWKSEPLYCPPDKSSAPTPISHSVENYTTTQLVGQEVGDLAEGKEADVLEKQVDSEVKVEQEVERGNDRKVEEMKKSFDGQGRIDMGEQEMTEGVSSESKAEEGRSEQIGGEADVEEGDKGGVDGEDWTEGECMQIDGNDKMFVEIAADAQR